jgi:hypothetical protein
LVIGIVGSRDVDVSQYAFVIEIETCRDLADALRSKGIFGVN